MPKFAVTVEGAKYAVEAPDEGTAWEWANQTHKQAPAKSAPQAPRPDLSQDDNWKPPVPVSAVDRFLGAQKDPLATGFGRFIQGAAELPAGLMGLGRKMQELKARTENMRGEDKGSFDAYRMGGSVASAAALPGPTAVSLAGKVAQGAGLGAVQGSTEGAEGAGVGAAIGGALPVVGKVLAPVRQVADLFLPGGAERIATRYDKKIVGEAAIPKVVAALESAREFIPGSKPTAAQALANVPEGSPVAAQQAITSRTGGGVSAAFGQRKLDQQQAIADAMLERNQVTSPMREQVMDRVRMTNAADPERALKAAPLATAIERSSMEPGTSTIAKKTLDSLQADIRASADPITGQLDPRELYRIRKEVGNTIAVHAKETQNWDKKQAAALEHQAQRMMDDAIERSGGSGWKDYLREFSSRSGKIDAEIERAKAALKPVQRTDLQGGVNVAEGARLHVPQLFSRPVAITNAILRTMGHGIEPQVDAVMAQRYLNPQQLADALKSQPSKQDQIINSLLRNVGVASANQQQ